MLKIKGINKGDICIKTSGKETGKKCIVLDIIDKNFALITGPEEMTGIKRRRSSIKHLISTGEKISIGSGTSDKELLEMLKKTEKLDFMKNFNDK